MKYETKFIEHFSQHVMFTSNDARRYLIRNGASDAYIRLFLHNMINKGRMYRLKKGLYTFSNEEAVTGFAFRPFYYGLEYALTIRGLWTQQSIPVIITKTLANPGPRQVLGTDVIIHRISNKAFFGFDYLMHSGIYVPVAEPEKILLDLSYFRKRIDRETLIKVKKEVNQDKMQEYAERLGISGVERIYEQNGSLPSD